MQIESRLKLYYIATLFSIVMALLAFSYNAWRMEVTEANNNIRTASFEALVLLAEFEQLVYAAHYDQNVVEGNPRRGWVKVGLIVDLCGLISVPAEQKALHLKSAWSESWSLMASNRDATELLIARADLVRIEIKATLVSLD